MAEAGFSEGLAIFLLSASRCLMAAARPAGMGNLCFRKRGLVVMRIFGWRDGA